MQRSTSNELFIGLTISVILSLITNFELLMQRSRLVMDSEKSAPAYEIENWGLWFSLLVVLSQKVSYAIKNDSLPDKMKVGVVTVASDVNTYPLLIVHIFVLLFILLSMLLMHLFDKKQEMKLAYEKVKVEQLQNSYNALMEQINPHFFFNSLNGLNSLVRAGEQ